MATEYARMDIEDEPKSNRSPCKVICIVIVTTVIVALIVIGILVAIYYRATLQILHLVLFIKSIFL